MWVNVALLYDNLIMSYYNHYLYMCQCVCVNFIILERVSIAHLLHPLHIYVRLCINKICWNHQGYIVLFMLYMCMGMQKQFSYYFLYYHSRSCISIIIIWLIHWIGLHYRDRHMAKVPSLISRHFRWSLALSGQSQVLTLGSLPLWSRQWLKHRQNPSLDPWL